MFDKLIKLEYYIFTKVGDFMVINSSFDRSLWLMLACDRKNRYDIADFIRNIPNDLFERIYVELKMCSKRDDSYPLRKITKAFRNEDNDTYFYDISVNMEQIIINLSIWKWNDSSYHDVRQICIYPLTLEEIKNIDSEYPKYIGDYYHTISKMSFLYNTVICNGNDRGYELIYGDKYEVIIQDVDGKLEKTINIDRIPNEININDLVNKKSINKLVRKRR